MNVNLAKKKMYFTKDVYQRAFGQVLYNEPKKKSFKKFNDETFNDINTRVQYRGERPFDFKIYSEHPGQGWIKKGGPYPPPPRKRINHEQRLDYYEKQREQQMEEVEGQRQEYDSRYIVGDSVATTQNQFQQRDNRLHNFGVYSPFYYRYRQNPQEAAMRNPQMYLNMNNGPYREKSRVQSAVSSCRSQSMACLSRPSTAKSIKRTKKVQMREQRKTASRKGQRRTTQAKLEPQIPISQMLSVKPAKKKQQFRIQSAQMKKRKQKKKRKNLPWYYDKYNTTKGMNPYLKSKLRKKLYYDHRTQTIPKTTIKNKIVDDLLTKEKDVQDQEPLMDGLLSLKQMGLLKNKKVKNSRLSADTRVKYVYNDYHRRVTNPGYKRNPLGNYFH